MVKIPVEKISVDKQDNLVVVEVVVVAEVVVGMHLIEILKKTI
jgi:hypothetical protein